MVQPDTAAKRTVAATTQARKEDIFCASRRTTMIGVLLGGKFVSARENNEDSITTVSVFNGLMFVVASVGDDGFDLSSKDTFCFVEDENNAEKDGDTTRVVCVRVEPCMVWDGNNVVASSASGRLTMLVGASSTFATTLVELPPLANVLVLKEDLVNSDVSPATVSVNIPVLVAYKLLLVVALENTSLEGFN